MTVQATVRKVGPTPGNSLATVFPFAFKVFAATDLLVALSTISTGATNVLALNDPLGYAVALNADQNANPGGSITYNPAGVPLPATQTLTISSVVPESQGTHIINGGAFFANNVEDAVDKAVINTQDLALKVAQSVQFPVVDTVPPSVLPPAQQRASRVLGFDVNGNITLYATNTNVTAFGMRKTSFVAANGQQLFALPFAYVQNVNALLVVVNGLLLEQGADYAETSNASITLTAPLVAGDKVVVYGGQPWIPGSAQIVAYAPAMTIDASTGNDFTITDTNAVAFTINAPTNPNVGQRVTVTLRNASGGALGGATWNAVFKMAAWVNPANGNSRSITFRYDGANWIEVSRTTADIPN